MAVYLTPNNISDYIGLQVFDTSIQNDFGVGTIVSSFDVSGDLGVRVAYSLDRLTLNTEDQMSGIISYVASQVSGNLSTGGSYINWGQLSDDYVAAHPSVRGAAFQGMIFSPVNVITNDASATGFSDIGVFGTRSFKLVRKTFFDGTVDYYPDTVASVSGLVSISQLRVI